MLYLSIVEGLGGKPLIRIFFRACFLLNVSLFSLYILSCLFVSLYLSAFVRPALFVLTHFSRYCVCIVPSFFRISRTVMSRNFSNTSLWISPAWKSMLHESFRNFALARSPETARFSGRLEHPELDPGTVAWVTVCCLVPVILLLACCWCCGCCCFSRRRRSPHAQV